MRRFSLHLEYEGSDFAGWQAQKNTPRTIQTVLETACVPLGLSGRIVAAGRTDAGVHARGQVCHLDLAGSIAENRIIRAINSRLPESVRVWQAKEVNSDFHARFSCKWRAYSYKLFLNKTNSALNYKRHLWIPQKLDLNLMKNAAKKLEGTHDFAAFATQEERQTIRHVHLCHLEQKDDEIMIWIIAESFLRHMVRAIVGTLIKVGLGQMGDIEAVLISGKRSLAGPNVLPNGLYFEMAGYEEFDLSSWRI